MKWDLPEREVTWAERWRKDQFRISFLLRSVYDTLRSPVNLHQWGPVEDPNCKLCDKRGQMVHSLSGCQVALTQGRFRWRHDKVLRELADVLEVERRKKRPTDQKPGQIQFVRQGEGTADKRAPKQKAVLDTGHDWELRVDLDAVLVSQQSKTLVAIELTVPREENCEEARERKSLKYADLVADCKDKGWSVWLFPVEVGCRGFPARSVWKLLTRLGMSGGTHKTTTRRLRQDF